MACREEGFIFGLGSKFVALHVHRFVCAFHSKYFSWSGYVLVESFRGTYGHIECDGTENSLAECDVGPVSFEAECRFVAVVTQCSNGMTNSRIMYCN